MRCSTPAGLQAVPSAAGGWDQPREPPGPCHGEAEEPCVKQKRGGISVRQGTAAGGGVLQGAGACSQLSQLAGAPSLHDCPLGAGSSITVLSQSLTILRMLVPPPSPGFFSSKHPPKLQTRGGEKGSHVQPAPSKQSIPAHPSAVSPGRR